MGVVDSIEAIVLEAVLGRFEPANNKGFLPYHNLWILLWRV
jgi:hypothetical protein